MRKGYIFSLGLVLIAFAYWNLKMKKSAIEEEFGSGDLSTSTNVFRKIPLGRKTKAALTTQENEKLFEKNEFALDSTTNNTSTLTKAKSSKNNTEENLLTYTIDDGVAVTQGDIALGEFQPDALLKALSGAVKEPEIKLWPTREIPYFIQSEVSNKGRIQDALKMFEQTHIQFVPYNENVDAIVFERAYGVCKSYLGYIGGLQKIYISDGCGAREIAHEIMHSLGFIHEQNRTDRDLSIQILWDNISPSAKVNFEMFSPAALRVSGLASFDFQSIMLYPETMFSVNNQATMRPVIEGKIISPSAELSPQDIERINKAYP